MVKVFDDFTASADDTILDHELRMNENPQLAEIQGVTKVLLDAGTHEPGGSTVTGDFDLSVPGKPSSKRYDPRDKRDAGLQGHEGYVVISGSFGQVKDMLKSFAADREVPSIIAAESGREIGLNAALSKNEIASLARYNATYLGSNKRPVALNASGPGLKA